MITKEAELTNSPKKEINEMTFMMFLDFLANKYLLAIKEDRFIALKVIYSRIIYTIKYIFFQDIV